MSRRNWRRGGGAAALAVCVGLLIPAGAQAASTDLAVSQADAPDPVEVGQTLTYLIKVRDNGPEDASAATLTERLSSHVDLIRATTSQGTCKRKGRSVVCDLGALSAGGDPATVRVRVKPKQAGDATSTATVETAKSDTDPKGSNNSSEVTTKVVEPGAKPTCAGLEATIVGTPGDDTISGTKGRDVIVAGAGVDSIRGIGGPDVVCANGGRDAVRGGGGDDVLKGGAGADRLTGGLGNDALVAGRGDDTCRGGAGDDTKKSC
jgi:uncharacterized repeat protein (TIGR01451 family)